MELFILAAVSLAIAVSLLLKTVCSCAITNPPFQI